MRSAGTILEMAFRCGLVGLVLSLALVVFTALGCERAPEDRTQRYFDEEVIPLLEARCAASVCHGVTPSGRATGEELDGGGLLYLTDERGRISNPQRARRESLRFVNALEVPEFSTLMRKPMPTVYGGLPHGGRDNFVSDDDGAAAVLRRWIEMEGEGGEDWSGPPSNPGMEYFEAQVLPDLMGRSCAAASCHGVASTNGLILDPGIPDGHGGSRFSRQMVAQNYEATLPFLALDGDPWQSRLLKKSLPLDQGGITHRGGNRSFFADGDDRAARAIVEWARVERQMRLADQGESQEGLVGFVYVKGPVRMGSPYEVDNYRPGSDLYLREPAGPEGIDRNLTKSHHDGEADIRDPAVSPDGGRIAFAMRRGGDDGHSIFELDLDTDELRRLSDGGGTDVMPTYGPGGVLYFVSDRVGRRDERGDPDLALYRLAGGDGEPVQMTFGVGPQLNPRYFDVGDMRGRLVMAHRRTLGDEDETVGFSLPVDFGADYHIFFGSSAEEEHFTIFEEMPDGRALTIMADPRNRWEGGKLAVLDRNLGPELAPGADEKDAAAPAFVQSLRILDDSVRSRGMSYGGVYRDPVALPDGTILVAWAPGPVDLDEDQVPPVFRILHLTLREASPGCNDLSCLPQIARARQWVGGTEGMSVHSPRPVVRRVIAPDAKPALDAQDATVLKVVDAPVSQGILENPFASGVKEFREDVRYLRLLQAFPGDAELPVWGTDLGGHVPTAILAEVELQADRSAYVEVPPNTPFRTQLLDERRMAVGGQHNRWIFAWPGQAFPESVERTDYDQACGGCHGAKSGDPDAVFGVIDAMSGASATLATFVDRNPRRPKGPSPTSGESALQITFVDDVSPIIEERCASCHGAQGEPAGGVDLAGPTTGASRDVYEVLMAGRTGSSGDTRWVDAANTSARKSLLVEIAANEKLEASQGALEHPETVVGDEKLLILIRWIETGAAFGAAVDEAQGGEER